VYGFHKLAFTEESLKSRINFVCAFFRNQLEKISRRC
jgi:hypothetical protein